MNERDAEQEQAQASASSTTSDDLHLDANRIPKRDAEQTTVVTVFGGGPAGLTAAHELVERGFYVQVVEPRESRFEEYGSEVGGLAASQYSRVKDVRRIHHYFYEHLTPDPAREIWDVPPRGAKLPPEFGPGINDRDPSPDGADGALYHSSKRIIDYLRTKPLTPTQELFPFTQTIVFDDDSSYYSAGKCDDLGTTNELKVRAVCEQILLAIARYYNDLTDELSNYDAAEPTKAWQGQIHPEVLLREILLLQVQGHYGTGGELLRILAWDRAVAVKTAIIEKIESLFNLWVGKPPPSQRDIETAGEKVAEARYFIGNVLEEVVIWRFDVWRVLGFLAVDSSDEQNSAEGAKASLVVTRPQPEETLPFSEIKNFLIVTTIPSNERLPQAPSERLMFNRVQFKAVEQTIAGEHGYRYFPSFYKQLFDTMKRTPIVTPLGTDSRGHQSRLYSTTYDNLVTPPPTPIASKNGWLELPRRRPESLEEMQEWIKSTTKAFGGDYRDSLRFTNRLLKFMTSCQDRRDLYENMSWLEFIDGGDELGTPDPEAAAERRTRYSERAEEVFRTMPQALVAMKAVESDARTYGIASVQNLKDFMGAGTTNDRLLNGPTSDAWLRPWKEYLKEQGVRFFVGHLKKLVQVCKDCEKPIDPKADEPCCKGNVEVIPRAEGALLRLVCNNCNEAVSWTERTVIAATHADGTPCESHGQNSELRLVGNGTPAGPELKQICFECDQEVLWNEPVLNSSDKCHDADHGKHLKPLHFDDALLTPASMPRSERPATPYISNQLGEVVDIDGKVTMEDEIAAVDFFVIALPFEQMADILSYRSDNFEFEDDFKALDEFVKANWTDESGEKPPAKWTIDHIPRARQNGQPLPRFKNPLRDFTGIQFFFDKHVRVGTGHVFYPDAQWGITSIAQAFLWNERPSQGAGYLGELSIDIGAMYTHYLPEALEHQISESPVRPVDKPLAAWNATRQQIANYTWFQIQDTVPETALPVIPAPHYYHLDQAIEFHEQIHLNVDIVPGTEEMEPWQKYLFSLQKEPGKVHRNMTPFLIALPGQFRQRPGVFKHMENEARMQGAFYYVTPVDADNFNKINYRISHLRWVLAGSFMPTHTRLNTMEAANETGRHAVNAILNQINQKRGEMQAERNTSSLLITPSLYAGIGQSKGMDVDIHHMERDELPDLDDLKRIDRELMEQGLPHVLDILDTMNKIDQMPAIPTEMSRTEQMAAVMRAAMSVKQESAMNRGGVNAVRLAEKAINQYSTLAREVGDWLGLVDKR